MGVLRVSAVSCLLLLVGTLRCDGEVSSSSTSQCADLCTQLRDCGLLPSALGTSFQNCETRCASTVGMQGSGETNDSSSPGEGGLSDSKTVLSCLQETSGETSAGGASASGASSWCSTDASGGTTSTSSAVCPNLRDCLLKNFSNPSVIGTTTASVIVQSGGIQTPLTGSECLVEWGSSELPPAASCGEATQLTLVGSLGKLAGYPTGTCEAIVGIPIPVGDVFPGPYRPEVKVLFSSGECEIRSGCDQLAKAGKSARFVVPLDSASPGAAGGGYGGALALGDGSTCDLYRECESDERCRNGHDDDGDGMTDCDDVRCVAWCQANPAPEPSAAGGLPGAGGNLGTGGLTDPSTGGNFGGNGGEIDP